MGPVWPALAQEAEVQASAEQGIAAPIELLDAATAENEEASPSSEQDKEKSNNGKTKDKETDKTKEIDSLETMSSSSSVENSFNQQSSAQKNQPRLPEADASTGALVYRYPITVPPGRSGLQPDITLVYNSQQGEEGSLVGYGWSISIPYIERLNKYGSQQLYTSNTFTSSLAGELIDLGNGNFVAKVDSGDYLKYAFANNIWTMRDKRGTTYKFGATWQARQDNPGDATKVFKWMLEEVRDTNNNFIRYEYFKDQGQIYPSRIIYTGNGSVDGVFEIIFSRELRTDPYTSYRSTFAVTTRYRLNEIQTKISGVWARKYALAYTAGSNNYRSLLAGITESGRAEDGTVTTLPPINFSYSQSTPGWQRVTQWSKDIAYNNYLRIGHANSDAYPDLMMNYKYQNGYSNPHIKFTDVNNTRDNWWVTGVPPYPPMLLNRAIVGGCGWSTGYEGGSIVEDLNGDYLIDMTKAFEYQENYGYGEWIQVKDAWMNVDGQDWVQAPQWQLSMNFQRRCYPSYSGSTGDFNGDGLTDVTGFTSYGNRALQLNNGNGFNSPTTTWISQFNNDYIEQAYGRFVDINRDGLADSLQTYETYNPYVQQKRTFLNKGDTTWVEQSNWSLPLMLYTDFDGLLDNGVKFVDINADGLTDLFVLWTDRFGVATKYVYLNTGNGWERRQEWDFIDPAGDKKASAHVIDINGDGLVDIFNPTMYSPVFLKTGKVADLLETIAYQGGGNSEITYKSSAQYKENPNSYQILNPNLPFVVQTVNQITTNDGLGNAVTTTYTYEGGEYYYGGPHDRKFAGFSKITKTDAMGNKTITYFHQGNASNSAQGEYQDHPSKIGYPYRVEQRDAAGNLYSATVTQWDRFDIGNGASFVKEGRVTTLTYDGNSSHRDVAETFVYDNATGNVLTRTQWGEVRAASDGSFTDIGTDKLTTAYTYASGGSYAVTGLPATELTTDQADAKVKESRFYYDNLALGSVAKGNQTKLEQWVAGTSYVDKEKTYNSYGLVAQELDARDKATNYVYDAYSLYPAAVSNALNQVTQYQYDYSAGKPKQVIDANGFVFQTVFDGLDRVVEEKQPDLVAPAALVTKTSYVYNDASLNISIKQTDYLDAATAVERYTYMDGLGRVMQTRQEAESAGQFAVTDTVYNNLGQMWRQSLPYFSIGSARTAATTNDSLYTVYAYDAVGRVISAQNAVGITQTNYDDWKTTVTDARGNPIMRYQDAYGRLTRVDEINGVSTYTTTYTYNGLGLLVSLTDAAGNVRAFSYDGLGRRVSAQDLHAPADTTFGTWTYTYDAAGNLTGRLDPNGQTVNYTYDDLNRQLTEDFTGAVGSEVTNTYDACTNGRGRLCSTVNSGASRAYTYNALGYVTSEVATINNIAYTTTHTYDRQGNEVLLTNPDGSQVKNIYNTAGQLESVQRKEAADVGFTNVVANFDYDPTGAVTWQQNANGTTTTNTYDSTKLYRLQRKLTVNGSGTKLQDITYTYDAVGNITRLTDGSQTNAAKTVDYTYDALNRLLTAVATNVATGQNAYSYTYTYDAIGNLLTRTETIGAGSPVSYTYLYTSAGYANPHAVTSITSGSDTTTYTYDNNGNLTSEGGRVYTWDYGNRLIQATVPGSQPAPVTASFFPAVGDGSVAYQASSSWDVTHDATTGTAASATGATFNVSTGMLNGNKFNLERAFLPFDTSALPDNATLISAKLKVYVASKLNHDNDGDDWITVVQGLEPSLTSLTTADYDLAGTINTPQEGIDAAERKDITSIVAGTYLTFNLNSSGLGWVSKTDSTKLALREGHDVLDVPFVGSKNQYNRLVIAAAEYAGTVYDPILEVTYTVPPPVVTITYAYDASGQRVKVVSNGVTTSYPSRWYNTDGVRPMKHIFAGDTTIATINGAGATAVPYYVATDHLSGSNVVTSTDGSLAELMDYYPFGSIRLDEKSGTFSEQRKFTGQEYDVDTGLSYMNARYYNGTIGRFISQDPLAIEALQTTDVKKFVSLISNPQNWNSYSYALNNPLVASDPSGLLTEVVHGTLPLENLFNSRAEWRDPNNAVIQNASKAFGETAKLFEWSGGDNNWERLYAASQLAADINSHPFEPGEQLNIVTHSHGGNIALLVSQMIDRKIDNLVTFNLPVLPEYKPDSSRVGNMVNIYSGADLVQVLGGNQNSLTEAVGRIFGPVGKRVGEFIGLGQYGLAGYMVNGAMNIDATRYGWNPITAHSALKNDTRVWDRYVTPNIIK